MVPVYYFAYRVGAWLLRYRPRHFQFHPNWNWLEHGLGPAWKPFLLGCLVCGIVCGLAGRYALELTWRLATMHRYRAAPGAAPRRLQSGAYSVAQRTQAAAASSSTRSMRAASRASCVTTTRLVANSRLSSSISANTCSALRAIEVAGRLIRQHQRR